MHAIKSTFSLLRGALLALLLAAGARADMTIYATTNPPSSPSNLVQSHTSAEIGSTHTFDIYASTDVKSYGIALDVFAEGSGIALTGIDFLNFSGPRWTKIFDGNVAADGKSIRDAGAYGLPLFGSMGLNPADPSTDDGYNSTIGAYHMASVSYSVVGHGSSNIWLQIGRNEIAFDPNSNLWLGVGDPPLFVDNHLSDETSGYRSQLPDGTISVFPEPISILLAAELGLVITGCAGRRKAGRRPAGRSSAAG